MEELKVYVIDGHTFQFREGEQPEGAVLLEEPKPKAAPKRATSKAKKAEEE